MKKVLLITFVFLLATLASSAAVMKFGQAINQSNSKPALVLVYANWAPGYQSAVSNFQALQNDYANGFNFVELNIAKSDTLEFNKKYSINPNIPYVLMFKSGGKIQRYIDNKCTLNYSCLNSRAKDFIK